MSDGRQPGRRARRNSEKRETPPESIRSYQGGDKDTYACRPGQHPSQSSSSYSAPYSRPSTSSGPHGSLYPSSVRDKHVKSEYRTPASLDTRPETDSTEGPTGEVPAVGRGGMRGRRVLPPNIITRPRELVSKQGGFGEHIKLQANYFKLLSVTDWCLYKWSVSFEPEETRNVIRKGLLRTHRETLGAYIFDGEVLYTSQKLPEPCLLNCERDSDKQQMIITIKAAGSMTRGDHDYIQFFNIIMRKCLDYLELQLVGRNYFDAKNMAEVREYKLQLWPGYITSIRQHENDILMCAEITHKVMRDENLLNILCECYDRDYYNYKELFQKQVIGVVVLTDYNNNTYRVDDVDFTVTPKCTFKMKDGREISYCDYYRTKYKINIKELSQPLLVSKSKPRDRRAGKEETVYLVPELCRSTGLTDQMRNNRQLMSALAKYTRVSPADRIKKLMTFNRRLQSKKNVVEEFKSWNLKLDEKLVDVPGRVMPADEIYFGHDQHTKVPPQANWNNDLRDKHLAVCGKLDDWILITPQRFQADCQNFVSTLMRVSGKMGFQIRQPHLVKLQDDNAAVYANTLEQVLSRSKPSMVLCVSSNNRIDRYAAIKKRCCVDRPVPTQVILSNTLRNKNLMSIATKVAIQMNCKIGGIPWTVKVPLKGLMVVGFDVCHDTNNKSKDFGAMVASIDECLGRYFSAVTSHPSGEELSRDLSVNLCKAVNEFKRYNHALPKRIVIYRDGVGEGQVPYVINNEVQHVRTKLEEVYDDPRDVKLAYIIVTKKINTRLFYRDSNPSAGTIVDNVVTDPTKYDFFIVSQHVGQGTVTPTLYNVVSDTSGLEVDKIQRLTYKLCHMYFNWSGTVRVPAPCQYAHKLAFLVSQAIHTTPSSALETLLYFL